MMDFKEIAVSSGSALYVGFAGAFLCIKSIGPWWWFGTQFDSV